MDTLLIITLGDPLGVTTELLAGLLAGGALARRHAVVLVGSAWQWHDQCTRLGLGDLAPRRIVTPLEAQTPGLYLADVGSPADAAPAEALPEAVRGAVSVRALEWVRGVPPGKALAVVTGPIDKHASVQAGFRFPGQTEFFESLWQGEAVMILAGPRLRVALATNHLALRDVPSALSAGLVEKKLSLFVQTLQETYGIARPRVAVCGVNPHAGDGGLFGDEEARHLTPALAAARARHPEAELTGPLPADTAFYRAYHGAYDGVLAMYHDQGLGPLKTVHFDDAVNLSGGLPHFRASPDHGPARDLFLAGRASPASFAAALALAGRYLDRWKEAKA